MRLNRWIRGWVGVLMLVALTSVELVKFIHAEEVCRTEEACQHHDEGNCFICHFALYPFVTSPSLQLATPVEVISSYVTPTLLLGVRSMEYHYLLRAPPCVG